MNDAIALLRSPVDGSPLVPTPGGEALTDGAGRRFPVVSGIPVLIPDLGALLREHFDICRNSGPTHPALAGPADGLAALVARGPLIAHLIGIPLAIEEVGPPRPYAGPHGPGTLVIEDGEPRVVVADACVPLRAVSARVPRQAACSWVEVAAMVQAPGPWFLTAEPFPDLRICTLHEILLTTLPADLDDLRRGATRAGAGTERAPGTPPDEEQVALNAAHLRFLWDVHRVDVTAHPTLDIGCGAGFLVAAAERAGAARPIGTDLRLTALRGFSRRYPGARPGALAVADMFAWTYPEEAFSFISVRNNSALAKARSMDARWSAFIRNLVAALAPGGLAYVSTLTDGAGRLTGDGLANLPFAAHLAHHEAAGARVVKVSKMGTIAAALLARPEDADAHGARAATAALAARTRAARDVLAAGRTDARALTNLFLAASDFAGEIALAHHRGGAPGVALWGPGLLAYLTWLLLQVSWPEVPVRAFVSARPPGRPGVLWQLTPEQARAELPAGTLHAITDLSSLCPGVAPVPLPGGAAPLRFLALDRAGDASGDPAWRFHHVSGDHDVELPPTIAAVYLEGLLRQLGPGADPARCRRFHERFLTAFPEGFAGVGAPEEAGA